MIVKANGLTMLKARMISAIAPGGRAPARPAPGAVAETLASARANGRLPSRAMANRMRMLIAWIGEAADEDRERDVRTARCCPRCRRARPS